MEFFSLRNNVKKNASNNKDSLSIKELISKLDILFEEQLSKAFKDIMILPRNIFLNIIISEVKTFIDEQYGEDIYKNEKFINFFSSSCNNLEDKYNTYLDELTKAWDDYQININLKNENIYFFSNFRKHCLGTDNYAMHSCSNGGYGYFIQVTKKTKKGTINPKKKNIPNSQIQYLICNKCKTVYFNNRFMNYCKKCNISYLCSILSYNEDPDLLLATLEKPHCDTLVNEKLKCSKCKDNNLYLNMKLNKLQCHNKSCTYNVVPYNIEWTCNQCSKIFHSNVKVYNPIEIQEIKDIINITLLLKKKAHPSKITCCKNINVLTEDFFHKKECKGLLYFGVYNSKTIIVCDKCKAINFLFKFIWTCPKCGTRFKEGEEKSKYYLSPKHENKRQINHKNNRLNESINDENNINNNIKPYSEMKTNNINRKNKETLSSILKRKSAKNISELSNNDNNNNISHNYKSENLTNSLNINKSSIKHNYSKKELNNNNIDNAYNNNINHNNGDGENNNKEIKKNPKNKRRCGNSIEKSLSESKINKTFKKKNSFLDKQMICGMIEPIKEETETKLNSPSNQNLNTLDIKKEQQNIQENYTIINSRKNRTRNIKKTNEKDFYNPQINNNSIFNNYIKYVNLGSNTKDNDENPNKGDKLLFSYTKKKNEDDDIHNNITNNIEEENKKIDYNIINSKRSFVETCRHRTKIVNNIDREKIFNKNETTINIKDNKKEIEKEIKNDKNINREITSYNNNYLKNIKTDGISNNSNIRNSNTHILSYYKTNKNKNENAPTTIIPSKYLFYKNKKGFLSQDNISDGNSSQEEDKDKLKDKYKRKYNNISKDNKNKDNKENNNNNNNINEDNISKCGTIKTIQTNKDTFKSIYKFTKNIGYQDKNENNENSK